MADLTTLASFKAWQGITTSTDDALIATLITAYSEAVRSYTNRDFTPTDYVQLFDGRAQRQMMLPQWPVISVASVTVGTQTIPARPAPGQAGYYFDKVSVVLDSYVFERGTANVSISWRAGYSPIPADIAQAVNELIGLRYDLKDKQGWTSKSLANETVSLNTRDMPATAKLILDQYAGVVPR